MYPAPAWSLGDVEAALQDHDVTSARGMKHVGQILQQALREAQPFAEVVLLPASTDVWDALQAAQRFWDVDPNLSVRVVGEAGLRSHDAALEALGLAEKFQILTLAEISAEAVAMAVPRRVQSGNESVATIDGYALQPMSFDPLTGLPSAINFRERLQNGIARSAADSSLGYAVLWIDLDHFRVINERLGAAVGDDLLRRVAQRLQCAISLAGSRFGRCFAARLGGDEFAVLIDEVDNIAIASSFAESLLKVLANPHVLAPGNLPVAVTASIGITSSDMRYTRPEDVLRDAANAMYRAKAAGKSCCISFDRPMLEEVTMRLEMENELRGAIDRGELQLHYQPIMSLHDGSLHGFEALVRWDHPTRGMVHPLRFVACSERTGSIGAIGIWILEQALRQLRTWQTKYPALAGLRMSVNVSPKQFTSALAPYVEQVLKATHVDPRCLALEITESVLIADPDLAGDILRRIRALGVALHVDDFGTGYSALSILHDFPLDGLKIDRKFMQNVSERRDYAAVVNSIVSLARNLGMKLIAGGIENADQVALLHGMDCDLAQGYLFDRPRDVAGAEAFIERQLARQAAA